MRRPVCVEDLQKDDYVGGIGIVDTVTVDGDEVLLTLTATTIKPPVLSVGDIVYVNQE